MKNYYYTLIIFLVFGIFGAFSCPEGKNEIEVAKELISKWRVQGDSENVKYYIYDYLDISPNPYVSTLSILVNTRDVYDANFKKPLALTVADHFEKWLSIHYDPSSKYLGSQTKLNAYELVIGQYGAPLTIKVAKVYELKTEPTIFIPRIQALIRDKKYVQGCRWAIFMGLERSLPEPETLLLPLLVQNEMGAVIDFLRGNRALQSNFLIYMDDLIDTANVSQIFHQFIKDNCTPDGNDSPIKFRAVKATLYRMVQKYRLSESECPNIYQYRREKILRYFIQEYREQRDLRGEVWRGLVRDLVGPYLQLKLLLVEELNSAGESREGLYWARYYDIPVDKWNGENLSWPPFRHSFKSEVIDNPRIAKVDKMRYLRARLSGAAAKLIENLPVSADAFDSAWALLASRFEDQRQLVSSQLNRLTNIEVALSPSAESHNALLTTMTDALTALDALGSPVSQWDQLLVHIVAQQLDLPTREAWKVELGSSNEYPSLDRLKSFLTGRVRALEQHGSSSVYSSSTSESRTPYPCEVCLGEHYVVSCPKFRAMTLRLRLNFVNYLRLCYNCLGRHLIDECRMMKVCKTCRRRHHTMLHHGPAWPLNLPTRPARNVVRAT